MEHDLKKDKLYIVMPAYNEAENIEKVVKDWYKIIEKIGNDSKLLVVNDGSTDDTFEKLCDLKNKYENLEVVDKANSGHGPTVLYAYNYALEKNANYIFQTDSDGQTLPSEFWAFWNDRYNYDAIIGHRKHREDGVSRAFVTLVLRVVLLCVFHLNIVDANTPFRLLKKEVLEKYINKIPEEFNLSNVLLSVLLIYNKEKVTFKTISFKQRQGGVNSINIKKIFRIGIKAVNDFRRIKKDMKKEYKKG